MNPQSRSDSPGVTPKGVGVMVSSRVPLGANGTTGAPPEFELPDDLADFAPTADLPWRVVHEDLRGVTSYELFLEQLEQPGFGELERVGVSYCD